MIFLKKFLYLKLNIPHESNILDSDFKYILHNLQFFLRTKYDLVTKGYTGHPQESWSNNL